MSRYRGVLRWRPEKGCWEISVADQQQKDIRIQPRDVFVAEVLMGQLGIVKVAAERIGFTAYTCEVYRPSGDGRRLASEARRFMLLLFSRYLLHEGQRVEWRLYRQRS